MPARYDPSIPVLAPPAALSLALGWMLLLLLCVPGCVPAARATSLRPHHQPRDVVRIIERLERQWQQAELHANSTVIASMLSDDYLGIDSDGTLATKAETLSALRRGTVHFSQIHSFDRKIRVFGTTAVVVSKAQVAGKIDGEKIDGAYRYTRVYHRVNGVWKIVSFEASKVRPPRHLHKSPAA